MSCANPLSPWLQKHHVTNRELAAALSKSEVTISRWRSGVRIPRPSEQEALAAFTRTRGEAILPSAWHIYRLALSRSAA